MTWNNKQLGFILYNNRSVEGVVSNFFPKDIHPHKLIEIEKRLDWSKSIYEYNTRFVELDKSQLILDVEDISVFPDDIKKLTQKVNLAHDNLSGFELEYLSKRGITQMIISEWKLGGLSTITDYQDLIHLNATCHPILTNVLQDGLESGGIIIPLFDNEGNLVNCAIRKIGIESNGVSRTLKYSLACPDLSVWGLHDCEIGDELWICEGLFDMMALRSIGLKAVSVSSAIWTGPQLYRLLEAKPCLINILSDRDEVGLRSSAILKKFFNVSGVGSKTWICKSGKDAAEVILEKKMDISDLEEIDITFDMIETNRDESFDFIGYLKNRKF